MTWKRIAAGEYESADGGYLLHRLLDVAPPAWNIEDLRTYELLVDGAATKRDAIALFMDTPREENRMSKIEDRELFVGAYIRRDGSHVRIYRLRGRSLYHVYIDGSSKPLVAVGRNAAMKFAR